MNSEDRTLAAIMWVLCIPFPFLSPLIFMLVSQRKPITFNSSVHAIAFSCLIFALYFVVFALKLVTLGLAGWLFVIPGALHIIVPIVGAVAAASGTIFEPLISGPVVKSLMRR
jgi:hypothetical protein